MDKIGVLVVDDDQDMLKLTAAFLKKEGMEVSCATCGEEALRLLNLKTFGLMITDFDMPGMKGCELAERVREIAPGMPIIMVTGDVTGEAGSRAGEAGVLKVFAKPLHFREMLETVRSLVRARNRDSRDE